MSSDPVPIKRAQNIPLDTSGLSSSSSSTLWERISTWASENKAIVYTVAGVAVVATGAGVVYYLSDSSRGGKATPVVEEKRKSKKERRKEKKKNDQEKKSDKGISDEEAGMYGFGESISTWLTELRSPSKKDTYCGARGRVTSGRRIDS